MKHRIAPTLAALLIALAAIPLPARADDAADARKALDSFLTALQSANEQDIRAAVIIPAESKTHITPYLDLLIASTKLQKAAHDKFGSAAEKNFGSTSSIQARLKAIREIPIKVTGDSAVLTVPPDEATKRGGGTIILARFPAGWKVDAASLFAPPEDKDQRDRSLALIARQLAITNRLIEEVNQGKFAAAVDLYDAFWTDSYQAARDLDKSTTQPAPETAPAPSPK